MKPEMKLMNLAQNCMGAHCTSPGPKTKSTIDSRQAKTDTTPSAEGAGQIMEASASDEKREFEKILKDVTTANKKAAAAVAERPGLRRRRSETDTESSGVNDQAATQFGIAGNVLSIEGIKPYDALIVQGTNVPELAPEATAGTDAAACASDASSLLQKAIETISQTLKLKLSGDTGNVQIEQPTPEIKELCAEMLAALKGIIGLLENAVKNNQSIDFRGTTLDAAQAAAVEKILLTEGFHIELALSMVGGGADVADLAKQKSNLPTNAGILQASSPAGMAMPATHVQQILDGDGLAGGQRKIEGLLSRLAQAVRAQSTSGKPAVIASPLTTASGAAVAVVTTGASSEEGAKTADIGDFDPRVMRTLLKIDKTEGENTKAAVQNEKMDIPKIAAAIFAKKPELINAEHGDGVDAVLQGVFGEKTATGALGALDQLKSAAIPKTLEESVMNQLSGRLQDAVKTGATEIRLLLRPESLGEMRVKLTLDGDVVMGKIYVENQQVKQIVESNLQSLKDSLAQHGLQTGSFDVNVGSQAREELNDLARHFTARHADEVDGLSDASETAEPSASDTTGSETGRRFGSNTIEYFA